MQIKQVGLVGCGLMGSGIAQVVAQAGYPVVVQEANEELAKKGLRAIESSLARAVERKRMTPQEKAQALSRIEVFSNGYERFNDCDLVIEAVTEDKDAKLKVFTELDKVAPLHAVLATNTSSLCVAEIAAVTKQRMPQVVGMHFFNPVPVMKLVEVVRSIATSDEAIATAKAFAESLGKTVVVGKDTPGFIVNRLLVPYLLDAIRVYEQGIASKEDIDQGMALGCNHPMGPLTLCDLLGLDTIYNIALSFHSEFQEQRFAPPTLLKRMVLAGQLGRKSGKGFYDYSRL